jgi:hypothetical protein
VINTNKNSPLDSAGALSQRTIFLVIDHLFTCLREISDNKGANEFWQFQIKRSAFIYLFISHLCLLTKMILRTEGNMSIHCTKKHQMVAGFTGTVLKEPKICKDVLF